MYSFRLRDKTIGLLDQYQGIYNLETRTEALENIINKTEFSRKSEINTPKTTKKIIQHSKTELIGCPFKDDWVTKEECEKCRVTQFNVWSDCYNDRRKDPDNPIFMPSQKLKS